MSLQLSKDSFIGHPIQFFHCYLIMIVFINYKFPFQDFSCCASASWVVHSLNSQLIAQHANLSLISRINLSGSAPYPSLVGSAVYHNLWFHESFSTSCQYLSIYYTGSQGLWAWFKNSRCGGILIQNRNHINLLCPIVFDCVQLYGLPWP